MYRWLVECGKLSDVIYRRVPVEESTALAVRLAYIRAAEVAGMDTYGFSTRDLGAGGETCILCGRRWADELTPWLWLAVRGLDEGCTIGGQSDAALVAMICVACTDRLGKRAAGERAARRLVHDDVKLVPMPV